VQVQSPEFKPQSQPKKKKKKIWSQANYDDKKKNLGSFKQSMKI
jgi:hypothetical protein